MKQKVFSGALNRDIAPKFLREEDYVGASNIIFQASKDGNAGILRRYPGFDISSAGLLSPSSGAPLFFEVNKSIPINGTIHKVLKLADGNYLIVGQFSVTGKSYSNIALVNSLGNIVNFNLFGNGFDGAVFDAAQQSDGKVVLVGNFTSYNGNDVSRIVRLSYIAASLGDIDNTLNVGTGPSLAVRYVEIDTSGNIYIASQSGFFYNGSASSSTVFKISSTGALDVSYTPPVFTPVDMKIQSDNKMLFATAGSSGIRRLNTNGTADGTFTSGLSSSASVTSIALDTLGNIYVSGATLVSGNTQTIHKLSPSGVRDVLFQPNITSETAKVEVVSNKVYASGTNTASVFDTSGTNIEQVIVTGPVINFVPIGSYYIISGASILSINGATTTGTPVLTASFKTRLPSSPVVIGSYENRSNRNIYFLVKGSDFDGVYRYSHNDNKYYSLIIGDLGFNTSYKVTGIGMIGAYLFWTDNLNEPRMINVTTNYSTFTLDQITLIKPAPQYPLTYEFITDSTVEFSVLTNKVFDFSYRYIYPDNQVSVIAPYLTQVFCQEDDPLITGIKLTPVSYVDVPVYVTKVEVLVRRPDQDNWEIFSTLSRTSFLNEDIIFSEDIIGKTIATAETIKYFESVPLKSKALEIARDRIFLANNTEGYDLYQVPTLTAGLDSDDTSSEVKTLSVYVNNVTSNKQDYTAMPGDVGYIPELGYAIISTTTTKYYLKDESRYYFFKTGPVVVNNTQQSAGDYTGSETTFSVDYNDFVVEQDLVYNSTTGTQGVPPYYEVVNSNLFLKTSPAIHNVSTTINISGSAGSTKFKNGSQYQIGIVFYDRNLRNAGVYTNNNCVLTINDDFRNSQVSFLKWEIDPIDKQYIPLWADSYQIVRTENLSKNSFYQGKTSDIYWVREFNGDEFYERKFVSDAIAIEIDVSGSFKSGLRYNYTPGDLIDIELSSKVRTFEIISALGSRIRINPVEEIEFNEGTTVKPRRFFYEIYQKKRKLSDVIFYEVGSAHRISEPGTAERSFSTLTGFLTGDVSVVAVDHYDYADSRTPVSGVFNNSDLNTTPSTITIESGNPANDQDVGWLKGLGRLNTTLEVGQVKKDTSVRWSNRFIQGTKINGTSSFEVNDEKQLSIEVGEINKLQLTSKAQQEGTVMLAICRNECASMYLGETQIIDNINQALLGSTVQVIGTVNVLNSGAGTIHPESVVHHNGRVWWWDFYNSRVLRYDPNGIRDLSALGMRSYFYGKGAPVTAYDPFHDLFFIGFGSDMLSYDEPANHWRSFHTFVPQWTSKVEDFMVLFHAGVPWRSNSTGFAYPGGINTTFYEFYVSSPSPQILDNISLAATEVYTWANAKQNISNLFEVLATNESGQQTSLIFSDFDVIESTLYAQFYRDINSQGGLRDGEVMRSDVHKLRITIKGNIGFETITINDTESSGH